MRTGEVSGTELKSARVDAEALEKTLCAFANSGGGDLIVGEGEGWVTGIGTIEDADELQRRITQLFNDRISPPLRGRLLVVEVTGESRSSTQAFS